MGEESSRGDPDLRSGGALHCPSCERDFPDGNERCPDDGTALIRLPEGPDVLVGRDLDGRFVVRERLGEGGMGTVYRAWQASVGREIALKIIHRRHAADATAAKRFLREARLASRLSHPHTVSVLDFGQTRDGLLYLAMELLRGRTLAEVIAKEGKFSVERILRIGTQLCDALEAAHRLQIVHRDLKPGNVVVLDEPPGRDLVKVLDFGLAKSVSIEETHSTVSRAGAVMGTPAYMSPEQVLGHEVDARTDLYSLGVILYEMLSRRLPFESTTGQGMMLAHAHDPPRPLAEAPPVVESVIRKLLEKDPADRIQSAALAREALIAAADASRTSRERPSETEERIALATTDPRERAVADTRPLRDSTATTRGRGGLWIGAGAALVAVAAVAVWRLSAPPPRAKELAIAPRLDAGAPALVATAIDAGVAVAAPRTDPANTVPDGGAAAVAPVAEESIELVLRSDPRASVTVDGKPAGTTPTTYQVPRGSERIRVVFRKPGYESESRWIVPDRKQTVSVSLSLDLPQ